MARYQKGAYKRDHILYNAKSLFYSKGISATTIKEIADLSEDPVSLVHYYFKKKEDIVRQIYLDFLGNIDLFVYTSIFAANKEPNVFLAHSITQLIYYNIIMNDPRNMRVYQESLTEQSNASILNTYIEHVYRKAVNEMDLKISEEFFQAYISIDFGSRRELLNRYYMGDLAVDPVDLVLIMIRTFPLLAGLPQDEVTAMLEQALEIYYSLDFGKLKFLV